MEDPTPAPSLDELPPEKGAILELHNISEEYDGKIVESEEYNGKLVEFIKVDKETGKYFVLPLKIDIDGSEEEDENAQFTRLKPKGCHRPDLKPMKLRAVLACLANQIFFSELKETPCNHSLVHTKLKGLLEKDPCCAAAYMLLAQNEHSWCHHLHFAYKDIYNRPESVGEEIRKHRDFLTDTDLKNSRNLLSGSLSAFGHHKTAIRQHKKAQLLSGVASNPRMEASHETMMAFNMFKEASKSEEAGLFSTESDQRMQSIDHFITSIKITANLTQNGERVTNGESLTSYAGPELLMVIHDNLGRLVQILTYDSGDNLESLDTDKDLIIATFVANRIDDLYEIRDSSDISSKLATDYWDRLDEMKMVALEIKSEIEK
ncbi:MAG: hypothetical protein SGARI_001995 [Bacillariaceae sp.]